MEQENKGLGASADADRATAASQSSPQAVSSIAGIPSAQVDAIIALLADFPSNGKPQDREAATDAHLLGFIEYREIKKPCRTCGTPQFDYSYFKPTLAGKLFLAFAQGGVTRMGGDCAAGSGSEASSTRSPQGDAPGGDRP